MKTSKLKNIIKETIKEIKLKEQILPGPPQPCDPDCIIIFGTTPNGADKCKSWFSGITQLGPFSPTNTNPNQPCNFIQNKITQIQTTIAGINPSSPTGTAYAAQLSCKLNVFQYLCHQYNCSNC